MLENASAQTSYMPNVTDDDTGHILPGALGSGTPGAGKYVDGATGAWTALPTSNGTWTPSDQSGASLTFTGVSAAYSQVGNMVFVYGTLTYPATASGSIARIGGLPVTVPNVTYAGTSTGIASFSGAVTGTASPYTITNSTRFIFEYVVGGSPLTNAALSGQTVTFSFSYPAS